MPSHVTAQSSSPSQVHVSPGLHVFDVVGRLGPASVAAADVEEEEEEEEHAAPANRAITIATATESDLMRAS